MIRDASRYEAPMVQGATWCDTPMAEFKGRNQ